MTSSLYTSSSFKLLAKSCLRDSEASVNTGESESQKATHRATQAEGIAETAKCSKTGKLSPQTRAMNNYGAGAVVHYCRELTGAGRTTTSSYEAEEYTKQGENSCNKQKEIMYGE